MGKIVLDTTDDRREIYQIIRRVHPLTATRWVDAQCAQLSGRTGQVTRVKRETYQLADLATRDDSAAERLAVELFRDLWTLHSAYGLDMDAAAKSLEQLAKRNLKRGHQ